MNNIKVLKTILQKKDAAPQLKVNGMPGLKFYYACIIY